VAGAVLDVVEAGVDDVSTGAGVDDVAGTDVDDVSTGEEVDESVGVGEDEPVKSTVTGDEP